MGEGEVGEWSGMRETVHPEEDKERVNAWRCVSVVDALFYGM